MSVLPVSLGDIRTWFSLALDRSFVRLRNEFISDKDFPDVKSDSDKSWDNDIKVLQEYSRDGKKIRPLIAYLSYVISGGRNPEHILPFMQSVELQHLSSLIIDDIMDEDVERRNKPSVPGLFFTNKNIAYDKESYKSEYGYISKKSSLSFSSVDSGRAGSVAGSVMVDDGEYKKDGLRKNLWFLSDKAKYSISRAIILGNYSLLFSRDVIYHSSIPSDKKIEILRRIMNTDKALYHGQFLDIAKSNEKEDIRAEEYVRISRLKTGALFRLCFEGGAILAGRDKDYSESYGSLGLLFSDMFQMADDLSDVIKKKGRSYSSDISEGKRSFVVVLAKEMLSDKEWKRFISVWDKRYKSEEEIALIIDDLDEKGILYELQKRISDKRKKIEAALQELSPQDPKAVSLFNELIRSLHGGIL